MKFRIIAALCAISMLLCLLAGCNAPQTNDGGDETGDSALTDDVKNKLTIAKALVDEVDEVKTLSAVIGGQSSSSTKKLAATENGAAFTAPLSTAGLQELAYVRDESDLDTDSSSATAYKWVDDIVTRLKTTKDQALEICKCLNTWVRIGEGPYSSVYRMNYDANTGTVIVEHHSYPSDINTYGRFTVTLDAEGKAVIDSYSAAYNETQITDNTELHYYEDKYYFSLTMHLMEDGTAHEDTVFLDLSNKVQAYVYMNSATYYENNIPVRTEYEDPKLHFAYTDGDFAVTAGPDGGSLAYKNGGQIGSVSQNKLSVNLNIFKGWTTVAREGDYVILNTNEKGPVQSIGFTENALGSENGVNYSYWIPYFEGYETVYIEVGFGDAEGVSVKEKLRGAFTLLARELGLTMDEALMERLINAGDRHGELCEQFHFKNGIYAKHIVTVEDYFSLLDMMRNYEMDLAQLKALYDGNGISKNEQPAENSYFEFLDFTINGTATLSADSGELSLAGMTASIAPSLLLKDGGSYSLVFAWLAPGELHEIGSVSAVYDGSTMSFASDVTVEAALRLMRPGEYRLVAFIAMDQLQAHDRISKLFEIGAAGNATFTAEEGLIQTEMTATANAVTLVNTMLPPSAAPQE